MSNLIIVEPLKIAAVASSRGSGAPNLTTADPKEIWTDSQTGTPSTITIDLGSAKPIDTIFLGYVRQPSVAATWSIMGGLTSAADQGILASATLRVPDATDTQASTSHALWQGDAITVRYITISLLQPTGEVPLAVGVLVIGRAFSAALNYEWGAGRRPIDTGSVTALPSGGFAVVEGARKRAFTWTFGDLTSSEVDRLEMIALSRGGSGAALVVENPARTPGLWSRVHYGLFKWKAFERRNRSQTQWEMEIEEWA